MWFYSPEQKGFFNTDIHESLFEKDENDNFIPKADSLISDAVQIPEELYKQLLEEQSNGKVIQFNTETMLPEAVPYVPSDEDLANSIRSERNLLLQEADIEIFKLEDNGQDTSAWRAYRQALRDVPSQPGFPGNITWPTKPV